MSQWLYGALVGYFKPHQRWEWYSRAENSSFLCESLRAARRTAVSHIVMLHDEFATRPNPQKRIVRFATAAWTVHVALYHFVVFWWIFFLDAPWLPNLNLAAKFLGILLGVAMWQDHQSFGECCKLVAQHCRSGSARCVSHEIFSREGLHS